MCRIFLKWTKPSEKKHVKMDHTKFEGSCLFWLDCQHLTDGNSAKEKKVSEELFQDTPYHVVVDLITSNTWLVLSEIN